jgi:hypothetical protein
MRVFKTRSFARFARQEMISDEALAKAIRQAETGLIDAELGGGLIKLRLARPGSGKRGGYARLSPTRQESALCFCSALPRTKERTFLPISLPTSKLSRLDSFAKATVNLPMTLPKGGYRR